MVYRVMLVLLGAGLLCGQTPEFGGPSILSRGNAPQPPGGAATIEFRPFIGVAAIYDSMLVPYSITPTGQIPSTGAEGVEANFGIYGYKPYKKTVIGLDYRGALRHYSTHTYYDGTDQFLDLTVAHQVSKRLQVNVKVGAGMFTTYLGLYSAAYSLDPTYSAITNPLFDNQTFYLMTTGSLVYQKTARLSFSAGGQGYLVRRRSSSIYGITGAVAFGDMAYRLTRRTTVGLDYNFSHFAFTKGFGGSDVHSAHLNVATRLTRSWEISAAIGGSRVESLLLGVVAVDPLIAAITGQTAALRAMYSVVYVPSYEGRLSRIFRRGNVTATYGRMVSPGNGVYFTSESDTVGLSASYTGIRKWNFGANAAYSHMRALVQNIGTYGAYTAGLGVTRSIAASTFVNLRVDGRRYQANTLTSVPGLQRTAYRVSLGVTFSPGDIPLRLW